MSDNAVKEGLGLGVQLPPDYTISQWADLHVMLSAESSAEPGRWRTDRAIYQRQMMDCITDPKVKTVVLHTSAQVGKTSVLLNGIGYHIHHSPSPMLMIQPTLDMAEAFSKDKLSPMLRDTPVLAERVAAEKSRSSSNTILHKQFAGGQLTIAGANSPTSLRMRSVKIVWADEIDAYPVTAGDEGDPLKLAYKRTQTFHDSKLVVSSTPTIKGVSRVDKMFEESDKRYFFVPCEACGDYQILDWDHVIWETGRPEDAHYACDKCGSLWDDAELKRQVKFGEWRATGPFTGTAGFHIWQIYSPWSSLAQICSEYEATEKNVAERQVWWNTTLGEVWDSEETVKVTPEQLLARCEEYPAHLVPERACVLTAGVDVQVDRLEVLIKAYGAYNESWCMVHQKIYGDPTSHVTWGKLEETLNQRLMHPSGRAVPIEAVAIDSGYLSRVVYDFSRKHTMAHRNWFAIRGDSGEGKVGWTKTKQRDLQKGTQLFIIGIDSFKSALYARLSNLEPGPDYVHFPKREPFDQEFFEQLLVERVRIIFDPRGYSKREWHKPPGRRNEALDLNVYADAVHSSLNINHIDRLARWYDQKPKADAAAVARMFTGG